MSKKFLIVTGASSGIGEEVANLFLKNNYTVYSIARRVCPLDKVISKKCDMLNEESLKQTLQCISKEIPKNSQICIVHNAGIFKPDTAQNTNYEFQSDCFKLMVRAPSIINQHIMPLMGKDSAVIYIGSNLSIRGMTNSQSYTVFKHAVVGLMRSTCQDTLHSSIHTACICPGFVDTPMHKKADEEMGVTEFNAKRLISSEEMAEMVLFAAQNSAINGSVIEFNSGFKQY